MHVKISSATIWKLLKCQIFKLLEKKNGTNKTTWIYQKITIFLSKESIKEKKKLNCQEIA